VCDLGALTIINCAPALPILHFSRPVCSSIDVQWLMWCNVNATA